MARAVVVLCTALAAPLSFAQNDFLGGVAGVVFGERPSAPMAALAPARALEDAAANDAVRVMSVFSTETGVSPAQCLTRDAKSTGASFEMNGMKMSGGGSLGEAWIRTAHGEVAGSQRWWYIGLVLGGGPVPSAVDLEAGVRLKLRIEAPNKPVGSGTEYTVNVDGIADDVGVDLNFGGDDCCPRDFCLIPHIDGVEALGGDGAPHCGFGAVSADAASVAGVWAQGAELELNVTELVRKNYQRFKVWAAPPTVQAGDTWRITVAVKSWGFDFMPAV